MRIWPIKNATLATASLLHLFYFAELKVFFDYTSLSHTPNSKKKFEEIFLLLVQKGELNFSFEENNFVYEGQGIL